MVSEIVLLYALSTLAQTCAALAAFDGALGLYRLQSLVSKHQDVERGLRGWKGLVTNEEVFEEIKAVRRELERK